MTDQTVPRCEIQEGCVLPQGHMGNCQAIVGLDPSAEVVIDVHPWPVLPDIIRSGKLAYEVCPKCRCVQDHPVHGWVPEPVPDVPQAPVEPETVDFLLSRVCLCIKEPSLMDIEDGGASQDRLLRRAHTLAALYQAKHLERIANALEGITQDLGKVQVPGPWKSASKVQE